MAKQRADQMLVDRGLAESRTRAQALIMAGAVFSGENKLAKAGDMLAEDAPLEVRGRDHPWVSRGGIKLDHGLAHFGLDVSGAVALDVGSSTGGLTDVLLSRGVARVYAVDVGTNQLAWKLRQDPRVVVHAVGEVGERLGAHLEEGGQGDAVVRRAGLLAEHHDVVGLGQPALDRGLHEAVPDHAVPGNHEGLSQMRHGYVLSLCDEGRWLT